ncbi:SNF2-like protein [Penicillium canescens]|nr:SNF2-like protein [Penicillium canescens]
MDSTKDPGGPSAGDAGKRKGDVDEADTSNKRPKKTGKSTPRKPSYRKTKEIQGGPIDTSNKSAAIINLNGVEAAVAGYIGFQSASQLRYLVCTWPVLQIWSIWHKEIGIGYKKDQFILIDRHLDELKASFDPHKTWPRNGDDDRQRKASNLKMRMAWCLVQLKLCLDDYASFSKETNQYMSSLQWNEIEAETDIKFPTDEPLTYPVPVMGPLQGEGPMEPFGRAWEILKYFNSVQGSIWSTRFTTVATMRKAPIVDDSNLPVWMQQTERIDHNTMDTPAQEPEFSHEIKVKLVWDASVPFKGQQALKNALEKAEEEEIWIPAYSSIMSHDPRICTSADLRKVDVTYTTAGSEKGRVFHMDPWKTKWDEMKAEFNDPDNTNFIVDVRLRARSEDQIDDSILESDDLLPGLLPPILTPSIPGTPEPSSARPATKHSNEESEKEDAGLEASLLFMKKTSKDSKVQARPKTFPTKAEQVAYYGGYDVETEYGRRKWQITTIESMLSVIRPVSRKDGVDEAQFISPEAAKNLHQAHQAAHHTAESQLESSSVTKEHLILQNAFGGTPARSGPPVEICLDLLFCEHVSGTNRYRSKVLGTSTKCDFFAYQINGAVGLLIKLLGNIDPVVLLKWARISRKDSEDKRVIQAAGRLKHLRLHAAICADLTGFGKTKLILLATILYSVLARTNKPTLLLVPSTLISQWVSEIETNWPYLRPIMSYGEADQGSILGRDYIKSRAMQSKDWPAPLAGTMNGTDEKARSAVIITSYNTHLNRTAWFLADGSPDWKVRPRVETVWKTDHQDVFGLLLADEAQKAKNTRSAIWTVLNKQKFPEILFATATPMYNSVMDLVGLLQLLGARGREDLNQLTESSKAEAEIKKSLASLAPRQLVSALKEMPQDSPHILMLLESTTMTDILKDKGELHVQISSYFSAVLNLIAIQRDTASVLEMSNGEKSLPLESLFKKLYQRTSFSQRAGVEHIEYQLKHLDAAKEFVQVTNIESVDSKTKVIAGAKALREMALSNCSTMLARLDKELQSVNQNTFVSTLESWRARGATGDFIHRTTRKEGELFCPAETGEELLEYLGYGSPCLRVVLDEILGRKVVHPLNPDKYNHHQKLILVDLQPANAWFIEVVLRSLLVGVRGFHSHLSAVERDKLIAMFNDPKSDLRVLVMTYDVGTVGLNLHVACDRVILLSPGRSWGQESQAIGRCLRVTSLYPVTAVRCFVPNSHDQYRFVKQAAKASLQLAVNSSEPSLQGIIIKLLNNIQIQVNACYASEYGRSLIKEKAKVDEIRKAALNEYLVQQPAEWAKAAKTKLDSDDGGATGPEIELPKGVRRTVLKIIKYQESSRSKEDDLDSTYIPNTASEEGDTDSGPDDDEELGDSDDDLFDTIDLGRSLEKILTLNFNTRESWKEFADRHQPDDNVRYLMALLDFPDQKSWSVEDLEDSGYLRLGLLLLYNHIRGIPTIHVGSSIHIQYPNIPEEVVGANKTMETLKGPKRKQMKEFLQLAQGDRE